MYLKRYVDIQIQKNNLFLNVLLLSFKDWVYAAKKTNHLDYLFLWSISDYFFNQSSFFYIKK